MSTTKPTKPTPAIKKAPSLRTPPPAGESNIRYLSTENVPLDSIANYVKNPRKGNVRAVAESLFENGQYRPIVLWELEGGKKRRKPEILAGNHTWKAAKFLDDVAKGITDKPQWLAAMEVRLKRKVKPWPLIGVATVDATEEEAKKIVLADNRTADLGGYDPTVMRDLLASLPDPYGTGFTEEEYALVTKVQQQATEETLEALINADAEAEGSGTSLSDILDITSNASAPVFGESATTGVDFGEPEEKTEEAADAYEDALSQLQGVLSLRDDMVFETDNYWGIPVMRTDMLMDSIPNVFDTWGGKDATPDDGITTWLWNYGATSASGLGMDRAILCFFTYDTKFLGWWQEPSFYTAKAVNAGVRLAVVPDFSFYDNMTRAEMLMSVHRAQWLGRYFQEAGIKVAPRIQFSLTDRETDKFNLLGIPKGAPVIMTSQQNMENEEHEKLVAKVLSEQVRAVECGTIVVYGGNPARRVSEQLKVDANVVWLMNVAGKRRDVVYGKKEGLQGKKKGLKRLKKGRSNDTEEVDESEETTEE